VIDLDRAEDLHQSTTPGPWDIQPHGHIRKGCKCMSCEAFTGWELRHVLTCEEVAIKGNPDPGAGSEWPPGDTCDSDVLRYEDAAFIVEAHRLWSAMCSELRAAREVINDVRPHAHLLPNARVSLAAYDRAVGS
jgi:hypothetical protein